MADPLLEDKYPIKGLYQALAVAAMCLQEEATTRPLISDVVIALEYLAVDTNESEGGENATKSASPKGDIGESSITDRSGDNGNSG